MHKLAQLCIKRPVFTTVIILMLIVFGVFGYINLGIDRLPKIDIPMITVTTVLPGSAPEEIETEITDKIEEAVNTVSGIDELRSVSTEGVSLVYIMFYLEKDIDVAAQEVRDKVNRILSELPSDIELPKVEKLDPDASPIISIALSGEVSIRELTEYADKVLRRKLESAQGVGQVYVVGGQKRQINVQIDPLKLKAFNLTVSDVAAALRRQNLEVPGGTLKSGEKEYTLRTLGRVGSPKEIENITIRNIKSHPVRIIDIGFVEDSTEEAKSLARLNDTPAVLLNIRKQSGTNTVEVIKHLKERLTEITKTVPEGFRLEIVKDQSVFVIRSVNTVKEHLVLGSFLAAVVVMIFLSNFRTTLISALAIPTSIISSFAVIHYMGFTLNTITLLALTLSVGIVIDDAIVVLENIFRFIEEKNYPPFEAADAATKEIGLAVLSITLTLVAIFIPIAFMIGIIGRFMSSFGITMAAAILISMIVSFTLTPMLAARFLKVHELKNHKDSNDIILIKHSIENFHKEHRHSASKQTGFYHHVETIYTAMLKFALRHRWIVVLTVILLLLSVPVLFSKIGKNFMPTDDQSEFQLTIRAPEGTSLEASEIIVSRIAREIRKLAGIAYTVSSVADNEQQIANLGNIYVRMTDVHERKFNQSQMIDYIRKNILKKFENQNLRMSITEISPISGGGMSAASVQFLISGPDMKKLEKYTGLIMDRVKQNQNVVDLDSSLVVGKPQFGVKIDREKAAELGVSVADIAQTIRLLVAGDQVSDYNEKGEQYEVHVRAGIEHRKNVTILGMVTVPSVKLGAVPLSDVVSFEEGTGPSQINRLNRQRQVTLLSNVAPGGSEKEIQDEFVKAAKEIDMGTDYKYGMLGRSKEMGRAVKGFGIVFLTAFLFAYLVIAAQFESWIHPFTILFAFPITLPFALLSLFIFNQSLNVFSALGVLVLFAVVMKNSILQIDHTNQLRERGFQRFDAIVAANLDRLRPILMTTIAFVAGMFPLLISRGAGAATNKTISSVIIGGQTLSLLLTLIAIPVIYSLLDDLVNYKLWSKISGIFSRRKHQKDV